ncbi:hypothetical protein OHA98_42370 [Streptomyces sp. NBC_00654]|uniref:hypothetical protein n=1 Tax=Streptomyces sp. NBC_00654 TaxID=2975799 RepID=UPI0022521135|nr:hypothetical protein [Streptomyces sp. NBC_00654]MCX4971247.1 hypothetical protein [Streptomyces sp. NBC_00654]
MTSTATERRPKTGPPGTPAHATKQDRDTATEAIGKLKQVGDLVTKALLALGGGALIFTCVNVTRFAMTHDIPWYVAWMLDPLASLALITVLYVDGVLAEQGGYKAGGWPFLLRWTAGLSTWVMNCWTSLYPDGHFHLVPQKPDAGGILLHSIAPVLLILLSEAASGYRKYVAGRLAHHQAVIDIYEGRLLADREREAAAKRDRENEERETKNAREREERDRDREREEREIAKAEREAKIEAEREEREHAARLERERRETEIELADRASRAEIERARDTARLEREKEEREALRAKREAELEADRLRVQAALDQEDRDREATRQADIIRAEAEAKALLEKAEAETRALEEAEKLKRQQVLERAAKRDQRASENSGRRASITSGRTSGNGSKNGAALVAVGSESEGRVPREVREKQRDEAERYVAKCLLNGVTPDLEGLANHYGKGETWTGDRARSARRRLEEEDGFETSVIAAALEAFATDDTDTNAA